MRPVTLVILTAEAYNILTPFVGRVVKKPYWADSYTDQREMEADADDDYEYTPERCSKSDSFKPRKVPVTPEYNGKPIRKDFHVFCCIMSYITRKKLSQ